jgi:hypothetical protein
MTNYPQLSRSEIKLRENIPANAPDGAPNIYRATAFIQYKTDWNDNTRRYEPMTPEQQAKCNELGKMLADAGVEISIGLFLRAGEQPSQFPKMAQFTIYPNKPRDNQGQAPAMAPAAAPAPAAPGGGSSWDDM